MTSQVSGIQELPDYDTCVYAFSRPVLEAYAPGEFFLDMRLSFLEVYIHSAPCALQFYGTNEEAKPVFFGDASSKKFGTYFVKDGKVSRPIAFRLNRICHRGMHRRRGRITGGFREPVKL